ncbi:MAG TPA: GIY-YIG nuclease family protein [bacterium]|nr:GIY-YIG nuclease family protein [bacterium]
MDGFFVYILECAGNRFYTGYSRDARRRYRQHCRGQARCRFTAAFPPIHPSACWRVPGSRSQAMRLERWLQAQSRLQKEELIRTPAKLALIFPELNLQIEAVGEWSR